MHSLLEGYLSEVAAHLWPMPVKQRNEELREMRLHLENALIVNRELGHSDEEAAQDIVAQFGAPQDLSENVLWAWKRGQKLAGRDLWAAAISAPLMTFLMPRLDIYPHLVHAPLHSFMEPPFSTWLWARWIVWVIMPQFLLVGGLSGFLFPKRAVTGVTAGMAIYLSYFIADMPVHTFQLVTTVPDLAAFARYRDLAAVSMDAVVALITLGAAWAGSRLRLTWGKRRRLAQV